MTLARAVPPTILWFRQDLRLQDNRALNSAVDRGGPIVPLYVLDDPSEGAWASHGASRWWLHHSLQALDEALRALGSRLILARGDSRTILREVAQSVGAGAIHWNRRYEPAALAVEREIEADMRAAGIEPQSFNSALLREPAEIANQQGRPFQVFTAYWRHATALPVDVPVRLKAGELPAPAVWPQSLALADLELLPQRDWAAGFSAVWQPGAKGAAAKLKRFLAGAVNEYGSGRDLPDREGTSRLSPHLHFGEVGPRQVWAAVRALSRDSGVFPATAGAGVFLREIGWREFAHYVLFHFPTTPEQPIRAEFARFPWAADPGDVKLRAWQRGRTGYPIVDAGMRQLWHSGWMHNRVRMIVGSFLVKHLRLPWNHGARWFWDTLVDADLANNTLGWQWSSGCGVDAAPYFRIFAPVLQGRKFDEAGDYVRRWVPELAQVPTEWIHAPWEAPVAVLAQAGVRLGENYPAPIVDHATARGEALAAFRQLRESSRP